MKLTPKQEKFCELYASLGNATEAAKQAGYSKKTAYAIGTENLKKLEIQKRLEELAKEAEDARIAKAGEVLAFFTDIMRDKSVQAKDRLRAAENLAKRMGLDKEKPEDAGAALDSFIGSVRRMLSEDER